MKIYANSYPSLNLFNKLCDYYASCDTMSLDDIWDEVKNKYGEDVAADIVDYVDEFRTNSYFADEADFRGFGGW